MEPHYPCSGINENNLCSSPDFYEPLVLYCHNNSNSTIESSSSMEPQFQYHQCHSNNSLNHKFCTVCGIPFDVTLIFNNSSEDDNNNDLDNVKQNFCKVFGIQEDPSFHCEPNPFCMQCTAKANELWELNKALQILQSRIDRILDEVGQAVLNSFPTASCESAGYYIQLQIYEKWFQKCNSPDWIQQQQSQAENPTFPPITIYDVNTRQPSTSDSVELNSSAEYFLTEPENSYTVYNFEMNDDISYTLPVLQPSSPTNEREVEEMIIENYTKWIDHELEVAPRGSDDNTVQKNIVEDTSSQEKVRNKSRKRKHSFHKNKISKKRKVISIESSEEKSSHTNTVQVLKKANEKKCTKRKHKSIKRSKKRRHKSVKTGEKSMTNKGKHKSSKTKNEKSGDSVERIGKSKSCEEPEKEIVIESNDTLCFSITNADPDNIHKIELNLSNEEQVANEYFSGQIESDSDPCNTSLPKCDESKSCSKPRKKRKSNPKQIETAVHIIEFKDEAETFPITTEHAAPNNIDSDTISSKPRKRRKSKTQQIETAVQINEFKDEAETFQITTEHAEPNIGDSDTMSNKPVPRKGKEIKMGRPKIHTGVNSCTFCSKTFKYYYRLQCHLRIHTGEKPYKCRKCERTFADTTNRRKHEITHDSSRYEGEPTLECSDCGKKFHIPVSLYQHRRKKHLGKLSVKKKTQCEICGQFLSEPFALKKHMEYVHNDSYSVNCTICGKSCNSDRSLRDHEKRHQRQTLERRYRCQECHSIGTFVKSDLVLHYAEKHENKKIPQFTSKRKEPRKKAERILCPECPESKPTSLSSQFSLRRHINVRHRKTAGAKRLKSSFKKTKFTKVIQNELSETSCSEFENENENDDISSDCFKRIEQNKGNTNINPVRKSCRIINKDSKSNIESQQHKQLEAATVISSRDAKLNEKFAASTYCDGFESSRAVVRKNLNVQNIGRRVLRVQLHRIDDVDGSTVISFKYKPNMKSNKLDIMRNLQRWNDLKSEEASSDIRIVNIRGISENVENTKCNVDTNIDN